MKLLLISLLICAANAVEFRFQNKLPGYVWVGCLGNAGHANLNKGGWILVPGQIMSVNSTDNWAGRFWGRTWCNPATNHCDTGDCGNKLQCNGAGGTPPASLVEITLKGAGGLDHYDISLVNGFNVEISMEPLGGQGDDSQYSCKRAACLHRILPECPKELQLKNAQGAVVGCNSACDAFHTDQYCCAGAYNTPKTCKATDWPVNYAKFFKDRCPDAYSYAYDDHKGTFTCKAPTYLITFGA